MADDIQINPASPQGSQGGNQGATTGSSAAKALPQDGSVIDLRSLDQKPAATASNAGATPPPKAAAVSLVGEADQATDPSLKYTVPALVKEKFPDLIQLIKETESMNAEEREYWYQILPIMTEDQIKKFRDILVNEKEQLGRLDKEYETELQKLNEKHLVEWKEFETKEKRKALTAAEQADQQKEKAEEEALLQRLSQI